MVSRSYALYLASLALCGTNRSLNIVPGRKAKTEESGKPYLITQLSGLEISKNHIVL